MKTDDDIFVSVTSLTAKTITDTFPYFAAELDIFCLTTWYYLSFKYQAQFIFCIKQVMLPFAPFALKGNE
ncbi:hypothetical protein MAR_010615 [Mya arenaria]|uniref:Hexosyltransferase n=1 Tax=Mya arenaria TaxID=6604 RepID=A0ABY7E226_MYAAR|nr:hypothetical protein MAR_010615 [Mya arenaria]